MPYALVVKDTCSELVHVEIVQVQFADVLIWIHLPLWQSCTQRFLMRAAPAAFFNQIGQTLNIVDSLVSTDLI